MSRDSGRRNGVSAWQIASTVSGHPGEAWSEVKLLMLFESDAAEPVAPSEPAPTVWRESLPKAA